MVTCVEGGALALPIFCVATNVEGVFGGGVSHAVAYCTNASRGLSATAEFLDSCAIDIFTFAR